MKVLRSNEPTWFGMNPLHLNEPFWFEMNLLPSNESSWFEMNPLPSNEPSWFETNWFKMKSEKSGPRTLIQNQTVLFRKSKNQNCYIVKLH